MKKVGLALALLAVLSLAAVPIEAGSKTSQKKRVKRGVKPKIGRWSAKVDDTHFLELDIRRAKKGNRKATLYRLQDPPCVTTQIGEFLGQNSRAVGIRVYYRKGKKARFKKGSFGNFFNITGDRTARVISGSFSSSKTGKVKIRVNGAGGSGCPHTQTWKIKYGSLNNPGPTGIG